MPHPSPWAKGGGRTGCAQRALVTERWYEAGIARSSVPLDPAGTEYYHTDMIGTTRLMTDSDAGGMYGVAYTAFGERITGENHRYGYAGSWGYQSHRIDEVNPPLDPDGVFPYLHVGARYYDPATGRFLQRHPIGIGGGLNVYAYVASEPTVSVDAMGTYPFGGFPVENPQPPLPDPKPEPEPKPRPRPKPETPAEELKRIRRRLIITAVGYGVCAGLTFWVPPVSGAFTAGAAVAGGAAGLL